MKAGAIVFDCCYNGLAIIRELGQRGVPVIALDSARSIGTYSRFARYVSCPDPLTDEAGFIRALRELAGDNGNRAVLFPTNDHWAVAIARWKDVLSEQFIPCVADKDVVELLLDKRRFYQWAMERNYPVPQCWKFEEMAQIPQEAFPLVAKPNCRRTSSDDAANRDDSREFDRLRLSLLNTLSELQEFARVHTRLMRKLILQEYVRGLSDCMYTVGVYANDRYEVQGMFTGRKVRGFPPDSGDCMVGEVRSVPENLKALVRQMCVDLRYNGIAEFEFKQDAISGEYKLIEVNPRSWSWIGITPACDVSLPWIAYADLTGVESVEYTESKELNGNVKWVRIFSDLQNCLYFNKRTGFPEWHMTLWQWWRSLRAKRLVLAEWTINDPLPGCISAWHMFKGLLRGNWHKLRRTFRRITGRSCRPNGA